MSSPSAVRRDSSFDPAASDLAEASFDMARGRVKERMVEFEASFNKVESEVSKLIVGMKQELRLIVASVFTGGHVLMEGTPGLAKTLLASSVATALGLDFRRIQFTPDLLPGDITGSLVQTQDRQFEFRKGPVFSNIILADEINRSTPKTQAALLEAMQERQVTADGKTYPLPDCFLVLATLNPMEVSAGTYPLPDAQIDRFSLKLDVKPPSQEDIKQILRRTTSSQVPQIQPVFTPEEATRAIRANRELVRSVEVSSEIEDAIANVIVSLDPRHSERADVPSVKQNVWYGPSPRGAQAAVMLAKVFALLDGRTQVSQEDLKSAIVPSLRHRISIRPERVSESLKTDDIIRDVMAKAID